MYYSTSKHHMVLECRIATAQVYGKVIQYANFETQILNT